MHLIQYLNNDIIATFESIEAALTALNVTINDVISEFTGFKYKEFEFIWTYDYD